MLAALLGRNVFLNAVREECHADLVVILDGREGDGGGNLGHHVALHLALRTEVQRATDVDHQHDGQLALLLEHLHVGAVEAGGHVPVDVAHVVAILVFAHLAEGHTPALEGRVVLPCEDVRTQAARLDFNLPDFL